MTKLAFIVLLLAPAVAFAGPDKGKPAPGEQKEADKHFKAGVALFKESKYSEALAEFERAYEIAPHPLVLYNIASCHRELSHYGDAVKFYRQFLDEGKAAKVAAGKLKAAQADLDALLARVATVKVTVTPADAQLTVDGAPGSSEMLLAPGEHKVVAKAPGHKDEEKTVRVASGDLVEVSLTLAETPKMVITAEKPLEAAVVPPTRYSGESPQRRFALGAAFGTNLLAVADTGAPSLGVSIAATSRVEVGVDAVLVAFAVMPSVRVRLAGDAFSVHATAAVPVAFAMSETFVAAAVGLGLRYRATPSLAFRLESLASFASKDHGTTVPTFIGGELWF
jgi:hypothetical protein